MYQSVPSLTIPPAAPRRFTRSHCPGGWVFAQLSLPRGRGFELEKFSTVLKELLDLFQRNRRQLEKQVFLCCFISIFAKTVDVYCIFGNKDRFDKISRLSKGHFC